MVIKLCPSIAANPGGMSTIRVLCLPLMEYALKVIAQHLVSVVWSASASDTRQPVNRQIPFQSAMA
ncbi:hypothetical protein [Nostoc sp.]|uniref:hypothetical protein n=1 Tax=Nostoc sp. TaxID=1180 RepID=UPI002FFB2256